MQFILIALLIIALALHRYSSSVKKLRRLQPEALEIFKSFSHSIGEPKFDISGEAATIIAVRSNWLAHIFMTRSPFYVRIYGVNEYGAYFQFTRVEQDPPAIRYLSASVVRSILGAKLKQKQ